MVAHESFIGQIWSLPFLVTVAGTRRMESRQASGIRPLPFLPGRLQFVTGDQRAVEEPEVGLADGEVGMRAC
jgi:hypothetical protein